MNNIPICVIENLAPLFEELRCEKPDYQFCCVLGIALLRSKELSVLLCQPDQNWVELWEMVEEKLRDQPLFWMIADLLAELGQEARTAQQIADDLGTDRIAVLEALKALQRGGFPLIRKDSFGGPGGARITWSL